MAHEMNKELILQHLTAARWLISDPECWTQGALARNERGYPVRPARDSAVCFCAIGAVSAFDKSRANEYSKEPLVSLSECLGWFSISGYNDKPYRNHAEVIALFDKAIAKLSQEIDK